MPVITVSRQFGAGGKTLTQLLSDKLGYAVVYEEIIEALAERSKISVQGVKSFEAEGIDKAAKGTGFFSSKRFVERILETKRKYMDGESYVALLKDIIPEIAGKGNAIILGRGAQFILKGHPETFHVLLVAERPDRIRFMQEQYKLNQADAEAAVMRQSKRRLKLMKLFHHEDYDQPFYYDMVLNMSRVQLDEAVKLITRLVAP